MHDLQLPCIVCVFDPALFATAAEISWKHSTTIQNIILRMGDFHTISNFMSTIGKRFGDAGLNKLCVEYPVIAQGSVQGVMEGRLYNYAIILHKLVYEALFHLAWR